MGREHPKTLALANHLAELLEAQGRSEAAEGLHLRPAATDPPSNGCQALEKFVAVEDSPASCRYTFTLICCGLFFSQLGFELGASFFPEKAEEKGVSTTMVGVIVGAFQLSVFDALGTGCSRRPPRCTQAHSGV